MENFNIFKNVSDEEMLEIYKDILGSRVLGMRPRTLDDYAYQIKEKCHFEVLSQATKFAVDLFYEEVASRYFEKIELTNVFALLSEKERVTCE